MTMPEREGITGAELLARQIKVAGIDTVFAIVAGPMLQALAALRREGIRVITCRHEGTAAFMAQAWGYVKKKPGVVIVGSGPGMANVVTGMYVANESGLPLVVLGGSTRGPQRGIGGFQEAPQMALAAPVTKWCAEVPDAGRIPDYMHMALGRATAGRPGATYLDFPGHLMDERPTDEVEPRRQVRLELPASSTSREIEEIVRIIEAAERPLVTIGKGAAWAGAAPGLTRLADLGIPFITSPMSRGTVPDDHPMCMNATRSQSLAEADVVLMMGGRFNWIYHFGRPPRFAPDVRIVHIDVVSEELYSAADVELGIVADCAATSYGLADALTALRYDGRASPWAQGLAARAHESRQAVELRMATNKTPISHYRLWGAVRHCAARDATIVVDGEITLGVGRVAMPSYLPRHRLDSGTTGCMGVGVPYAIGARHARPEGQVIAVLGDYAFGTACMEIETAARTEAPVVYVVDNNGGVAGRMIQDSYFRGDREMIASLLPAGYEKMAEMVGGHAERVTEPAELEPAIQRALASGKVAIVNVITDPSEGVREGFGYLMD